MIVLEESQRIREGGSINRLGTMNACTFVPIHPADVEIFHMISGNIDLLVALEQLD